MKNYPNNMPVLEKSKLTSVGITMLAVGFLCAMIRVMLDSSPAFGVIAIALGSVGFPSLLAGLVCDCLTRIHNANAYYLNNKD